MKFFMCEVLVSKLKDNPAIHGAGVVSGLSFCFIGENKRHILCSF